MAEGTTLPTVSESLSFPFSPASPTTTPKTLGSTLTEIASNKADIIKGNDAVLYPVQDPEALAAVMKRCAEVGSKLMTPALSAISIQKETLSGTDFLYGEKNLPSAF